MGFKKRVTLGGRGCLGVSDYERGEGCKCEYAEERRSLMTAYE